MSGRFLVGKCSWRPVKFGRLWPGFGPALAVCFAEFSSSRCRCAIYEGEAHALEVEPL